jgi:hypothetical protein
MRHARQAVSRHDICHQKRSQGAACESTARITHFSFPEAWHPRLNTDPRHVWLRKAVRSTVPPNG